MAQEIFKDKPYYDRFNPTQNRTQVLFQGDRALQQSELNELQSIQSHYLGALGDSIFKDGNIQDDMNFQFLRTGSDPADQTAPIKGLRVRSGRLYLSGKIRPFEMQETDKFTGKGHEEIGVKLVSRIITSSMDQSLLDLTQDVANYASEGADRLEEKVVLTYNDTEATTIYVFDDGQLFTKSVTPESDLINKALATFDSETLGSYQITGFNMYLKEEPKNDARNYITVAVDKGIAHVNGWRVEKPSTTLLQVPKEKSVSTVVNSEYTYRTGVPITVASSFVQKVNRVSGKQRQVDLAINRNAASNRDTIDSKFMNPSTEGSIVIGTLDTQTGHVFKPFTDYRFVVDGSSTFIEWQTSAGSVRPKDGTGYKATFDYSRLFIDTTDYTVSTVDNANGVGSTTKITFKQASQPADGSVAQVTFDYALAREDIVMLGADGKIYLHSGEPDEEGRATITRNVDPFSLKLGNIHIYPNSEKAVVKNTAVTRLRFEDLQVMKSRLEQVEANQAVLALERVAQKGQEPLRLRGLFVDPFTDFSRMDKAQTNVSFSFDDAHITIPTDTPDDKKKRPSFLDNESHATKWGANGRIVTAPFKETAEIVQNIATSPMNVNPYQVFQANGTLQLTPSSDNWIDESRVTLYNEEFTTTNINRWWAHVGEANWGELNDYNQWLVDNTNLLGGAQWNEASLGWSKTDKAEGEMWSSAQTTRSEMIEYMRSIDVTFRADGFAPLTSGYYIEFDGVRTSVTPATGHEVQGQVGVAKSDGEGVIRGTFKIPQNIRTGTREVVITNRAGDPSKPNGDGRAITTFSAQGTSKITTDTITRTHVTFQLYDPLAQSFVFPQARVVSSIGVYFATKDPKLPITMQVRGISDGGLPNRTVYSERVLKPNQINVSDTGLVETKIALDDPLMVEAGVNYCVVFITDSPSYNMWTATMGENNKVDGSVVTSQPYVNGVLFSSSNAVSWSVHQSTDMKFKIYTAEFDTVNDTIVEFDVMRDVDSNGLLLMASYLTPENTGCTWEVKILNRDNNGGNVNSGEWLPLANYASVPTPFVVSQVKLRARFKPNRYISPMLALDDLLFVNFVSKESATYTTLATFQDDAPFDTLTLEYSAALPAGSDVKAEVMLDGDNRWLSLEGSTTHSIKTSVVDNQEFMRYNYQVKLDDLKANAANQNRQFTQVKYRLLLSSTNRLVRPRVKKFTAAVTQRIRA